MGASFAYGINGNGEYRPVLNVVTFEEQVILAAQFGRAKATNYLLCKWEEPKNRFIGALARQYGLDQQDTADAKQEAVFWLIDVITKYKFDGPVSLRQQRLRAFLKITLKRRLMNFLRGVQRKNRRIIVGSNQHDPAARPIVQLQIARSASLDPALTDENSESIE